MYMPNERDLQRNDTQWLISADLQNLWHPFKRSSTYAQDPLLLVRGEGSNVYDVSGRKYFDAISGLWAVNYGYSERRIIEAIGRQLMTLPAGSLIAYSNEPAARLARVLASRLPDRLSSLFFTSGGSEAIETALKLARHYMLVTGLPKKQHVIALRRAYHGMSYGALSLTGITEDRTQFGVLPSAVYHVPPPFHFMGPEVEFERAQARALEEFDRALAFLDPLAVAAVILEPVMGVAGMRSNGQIFLQGVRERCTQHNILFIADEVVSGFGRTGSLFAFEHFGVEPDMAIFAKGITGGYAPLGAVAIASPIQAACEATADGTFMHGFTFGGSPPACAAALSCLDVLDSDQLLSRVKSAGQYLLRSLSGVSAGGVVRDIRGVGLMVAFDMVHPRTGAPMPPEFGAAVRREAASRGQILRPTYGGYSINLAPPFISTNDELDALVQAVDDSVGAARRNFLVS
jgi:adenosylmethionine-8-amino-7-oxononanoate aminotransferase